MSLIIRGKVVLKDIHNKYCMKKLFPSSKTIFHSLIILPILIVAAAITYYLIIFLPEKERFRQEIEKDKLRIEESSKKQAEEQLANCLEEAEAAYRKNWDLQVKRIGSKDETLPVSTSDRLKDRFAENQELCVKKYK